MRGLLCILGSGAVLLGFPALARDAGTLPAALTILSDEALPRALHHAQDIRWASDGSVFLALARDGTVETSIKPAEQRVVEWIPGSARPGGAWGCSRLAVSTEFLVAAAPAFTVTWRTLNEPMRREATFDLIDDVDVWKDRLVVLAARRVGNAYAPEGAIAWWGTLRRDLSDLRPLLYDGRGAGAPNFTACTGCALGKVRFLRDGSFLVVPGVQPGAHLYDSDAALVHTWDTTTTVGLDSDCAGLSKEMSTRLASDVGQRAKWIDQRHTLDEILPLSDGAGLVVRSGLQGRTGWRLAVLRRGKAPQTFEIPIAVEGARFHLKGDVRGSRIAFLVHSGESEPGRVATPRLVIATVPEA